MRRHRFEVLAVGRAACESLATFAAEGDAYAYGREKANAPHWGAQFDTIQTRRRGEAVHVWPIRRAPATVHP